VSNKRIPALDGVRGLAVLGVVAHHLDALPGGYLGVDAFFVLSGFLITGLLIDEASASPSTERPISLGAFWTRRAKRLLPALGALLLVVVVVERWVITGGMRVADLRNETIAAVLYVFNWQQINDGVDYWSTFDTPSPLRHMWSLAIEEQFYVLWPLLVVGAALFARRRKWSVGSAIGWAAAGLALTSVVWSQVLFDPRNALRSYYGTDVRVAAILFGATVAVLVRRSPTPSPAAQRRLAGLGALTVAPIAWAWISLDGESDWLYRGGLAATGLATAFVMFVVVQAPSSLLARGFSLPVLRWFGTISYGLYLWHWPLIVWLTPARVGIDGWQLLSLRLAASLAVTMLSYWLIEQPIRHSRWTGKVTTRWSVAGAVIIVASAAIGVTATTDDRVQAGTRDTTPIPTLPTTTTTTTSTITASTLPSATTEPVTAPVSTAVPLTTTSTSSTTVPPAPGFERLLVVGDSGAYFLGEPITQVADDVTVVQRGQVGCGVLTDGGGVETAVGFLPDAAECASFPTRLLSDVGAFQPTDVVFVYSWPGNGEREIDGVLVDPCQATFATAYERQLAALVAAAGSTGARVVVADVPYFTGPDGATAFVETTDCLNQSIERAVGIDNVVPLASWVCPGGACLLQVEGETLRADGLHFEGPGGLLAADWIVEQLRARAG
jgi:peptidoglycan/LPS O-acetylase OafA/YrhL